jgi:hypothetical protein
MTKQEEQEITEDADYYIGHNQALEDASAKLKDLIK